MIHKKVDHLEQVQLCIKFSDGKCTFGDTCWFSHNPNTNKSWPDFNCNICDETFKLRSKLIDKHIESVQKCKSENSCQYDNEKCWFKHEDQNNGTNYKTNNVIEDDENSEMMKKLVEMVEKYSERIIILENMMDKND